MTTTVPRLGLFLLAGWAMFSPGTVLGRDPDQAARLYSAGVHAYFAGRTSEAESLLSRALALNELDPRFYYFRGLSRLRLGREGEARADLAAGASLESNHMNRFAVGASLARVQGSHRLLLEQYRREARSRAATVESAVARQRASQIEARDAGVLRQKVVIPLDELLRPGGPQPLSAEEVAGRAAVIRQQNSIRPLPPMPSAAPAAAAESNANPFQDDAEPAEVESSPTPEPSPPSEAPAEDADENPFGDF